ncbi:hypothetical protein JVX90_13655 [Gordonia sp. PDNC005]|uniref:hypothetical protein n=1 Tax=Gordonia sp. PDNC005 TaxID=2811424 RepID=UPI00196658E0|nr:hypothetical protein [Gordonia sp. PDNC005]QRY61457.1 hypothetical protein JVX90_13655 [Gordonia sp. PDNC005]
MNGNDDYRPKLTRKRTKSRLTWLIAFAALATAVILAVQLAPASAETPAQRCKRETSAYNNAWKAIGQKPPTPYKCGESNNQAPPAPSQSPTPNSDESGAPESNEPDRDAPNKGTDGPKLNPPTSLNDHENSVDPNQPTISQKPGQNKMDTLIGKPMRYIFANSLAEARQFFKDIENHVANGAIEYGPCVLSPQNVHIRTKTRIDGDPRLLGFKSLTECSYPMERIEHTSRLYYSYYTMWLNVNLLSGNPTPDDATNSNRLYQQNVIFRCNGVVGTSFKGETIGMIKIPGRAKPMYAKVITNESKFDCEV